MRFDLDAPCITSATRGRSEILYAGGRWLKFFTVPTVPKVTVCYYSACFTSFRKGSDYCAMF
jgi:hypothetical protein